MDIFVEHIHQPLNGDELRAGVAVRQGLRLEQQHQFYNLRTHLFTGSAGMGHDQVVLELAQVLLGNGYIIEGTEAGGDTIDRPADVVHLVVQVFAALDDSIDSLLRKGQFFMSVQDFFYSLQGEMRMRNGMHSLKILRFAQNDRAD